MILREYAFYDMVEYSLEPRGEVKRVEREKNAPGRDFDTKIEKYAVLPVTS